jgi:hypothetical protein
LGKAVREPPNSQLAQKIALAKTAVAVLGKRRMIGDIGIELQATEPAVRQIEMDLLAQPTLRTNAEAMPTMSMRIISSGSIEGRPASP